MFYRCEKSLATHMTEVKINRSPLLLNCEDLSMPLTIKCMYRRECFWIFGTQLSLSKLDAVIYELDCCFFVALFFLCGHKIMHTVQRV
jgi:hypothetical protein